MEQNPRPWSWWWQRKRQRNITREASMGAGCYLLFLSCVRTH